MAAPASPATAGKRDRDEDHAAQRAAENEMISAAVKEVMRRGDSNDKAVPAWQVDASLAGVFTEACLDVILRRVREELLREGPLVRLAAPVHVCGDIHGQLHDLLSLFNLAKPPPTDSFLFLGDYVDRGKYGIESVALLMGLKVLHPDKMYLLRGNHETAQVNKQYGFFDECKKKFSVKLYKKFSDVFMCLPLAGLISDAILCMHGGISQELTSLNSIERLKLPAEVPDAGLACDLLWADPDASVDGWATSDRGVSFLFGKAPLQKLLDALDIDLVVRAHQVMEKGYSFFDPERRLVTVFSATNYCGQFANCGGMLNISENLDCTFSIIKPRMPTGAAFAGAAGM